MNLSYWEIKSWFQKVDYTIVGSGIVGLNCALKLKSRFPKSKILIIEKGMLPEGASTKNAGFACFGSISEILEDLKTMSEDEVVHLIERRFNGLKVLRETLGDEQIGLKNYGGYEIFYQNDNANFNNCSDQIPHINKMIRPIFNRSVFKLKDNIFNFKNVQNQLIYNPFESQIDTGKMMSSLLNKVLNNDIKIINNVSLKSYEDNLNGVTIETDKFEFHSKNLLIATNGFAGQLINENVRPARAQVLITKPIVNLSIKGTFHLDKGFYYFRNIDKRILLGGGRNLDFKTEETANFGLTDLVQKELEKLLRETILPTTPYEIEHRWSGIMGIGPNKKTIIKQLSNNVYCGVRLGGMGVAIGSIVGAELAELVK